MPFVSTKSAVAAAPQLLGGPDVDTVLSARQKELELQETELDRKESDLRLSSATPSVHEARWACLREERHALAQKWACLAQDKRLRADREQMMLSAAMMGAPLAQAASRDVRQGGGGGGMGDGPAPLPWAALPPLQHTYCALWSVQQIQWLATAQQQQQADMPAMSCCFQR
ncbi:hypothetical protein HYH02_013972 [Chlamydomonas schloesseri]|uniref:Uncharacterized protein n=1 Tax=Chlamydomonas schloesseri TaxID=2026947 RepID=A0A835VVR5_9CHLO|nr:hypothetical protein HYH02_013972 [Chlamydomonas schloesseri]|eukprot:KAG2429715.1 hypothetical protein HYH02_013972 [Chlamydomonas schloesseri]